MGQSLRWWWIPEAVRGILYPTVEIGFSRGERARTDLRRESRQAAFASTALSVVAFALAGT